MALSNGTEPIQIFLAEDNPADVFLIREALHEHGLDFVLSIAENGERAINWISQADAGQGLCPHLIVLDLNLPRLDGSEVLQAVRKSCNLRAIPVVILTSSDSPQDREMASRLGATLYLRKPCNLEEFMQIGSALKELLVQQASQPHKSIGPSFIET
jgi:CheY-like chemotaxis protein